MAVTFDFRRAAAVPRAEPVPGTYLPGRNGDAVILIHGLTGTPVEMRFLAWYLNTRGFTVSCPRLANHGEPLAILKRTRWPAFYESVRSSHQRLTGEHRRVFVAGLSMGALLALLLAQEFPDRVAGVSCLSPTFFYDGWNVPWYHVLLPLVSHTPLGNFVFFREEPPYGLKNERIREKVHAFYCNARITDLGDVDRYGYPFFPVRLLGELQRLSAHLRPRLPGVRCPCQVIQARNDDMSSPRNAQLIHESVGSHRREIVYLEDSYHVITADQERGRVAESLFRFFAEEDSHA